MSDERQGSRGREEWTFSVSGPAEQGRPDFAFGPGAGAQPRGSVPMPAAQHAGDTLLSDGEGYSSGIGYGLWCLAFLGVCGVHRLYMGMWGTGILWLITFGLFGVGQFVDLFRMRGLARRANIRSGYQPHPRFAPPQSWPGGVAGGNAPPRSLPKPDTPARKLLKAAEARGGDLTVAQGVIDTGMEFEEVDQALRAMQERGYAELEVTDDGGLYYRFPGLTKRLP